MNSPLRLLALACIALAAIGLVSQAAFAQDGAPSPYDQILKDAKTHEGLLKLIQKGQNVYVELSPGNLNKDYIVLISISRGIGQGMLLGGMSWGFGDDWLWQFRKIDDERVHLVRRNVRFTAKSGSPEEKAVKLAYSDSVLFSLPVAAKSPGGGMLIDVTPVFMSDLPQISSQLRGFAFAPHKSTWEKVKAFADNVELEIAATYQGGGEIETVPDTRGVTVHVHYSISALPNTGYQPRLADDRIGYFLTAIKDFSKQGEQDQFVRYINRWDLQKLDPALEKSPPKKPVIFWLEKTVPYKYRNVIREAILEWNKAYEQVGFVDAIEVRQQPDNAEWDPEDVNYNTFRWITSNAGFAMGPSRVNPTNGQILDADIIFDADFVESWKEEYETFNREKVAELTGGPLDLESYRASLGKTPHFLHNRGCGCSFHSGFSREFAFGQTVLLAMEGEGGEGKDGKGYEELIRQGLKEVVMHEVGHTLGLRHNFKASALLDNKDLNNLEKTTKTGLTASVMDYAPVNIAPKGVQQGHYYSQTIGPYDYWAIEYGYKPLSGGTEGEVAELKKIGAKSGEPGLSFSTDEDTRGIDSDPLSNRFDLSSDPIANAQEKAGIIAALWPELTKLTVKDGEGYQKARRAFGILLAQHGRTMHFASRYVGGLYVNRDHKGDANARAPFVVVEPAKQREALKILEEQVFSDKPFNFPPELYNHLAASRWSHWGAAELDRLDYAVHDVILMWQDRILSQLLSSLTLARLHDSEAKIPADQDAFTAAELIEGLTAAIFAETDAVKGGEFTNRKPAISSLRRNLQRNYLERLSHLALGNDGAPEDCQTVAYAQLAALKDKLDGLAKNEAVKLDTYSKAHLKESSDRIAKVLDARLTLNGP